MSELLTAQQVADMANVSLSTVTRDAVAGVLPARRVGSQWVIDPGVALAYAAARDMIRKAGLALAAVRNCAVPKEILRLTPVRITEGVRWEAYDGQGKNVGWTTEDVTDMRHKPMFWDHSTGLPVDFRYAERLIIDEL